MKDEVQRMRNSNAVNKKSVEKKDEEKPVIIETEVKNKMQERA